MVRLKNMVKTMQKALNFSVEPTLEKKVAIIQQRPVQKAHIGDYHILKTLMNNRQFIEVSINSENIGYQSMILAVDVERELLWLDDLHSLATPLKAGDILHIKHHKQGKSLTFQAPVIALGVEFNSPGTALLLPDHIAYSPRRQYLRHPLLPGTVRTKIRAIGEEPRYGSIINLSAGGMRLAIAGNVLSELHLNTLLPLCQFKLTGDINIDCHARVKSYKMERAPYRHTQVSLEFSGIPPIEQEALHHHLEQLNTMTTAHQAA